MKAILSPRRQVPTKPTGARENSTRGCSLGCDSPALSNSHYVREERLALPAMGRKGRLAEAWGPKLSLPFKNSDDPIGKDLSRVSLEKTGKKGISVQASVHSG